MIRRESLRRCWAGAWQARLVDTCEAERRSLAELRHDQLFVRADSKAFLDAGQADVPVVDDADIELEQLSWAVTHLLNSPITVFGVA